MGYVHDRGNEVTHLDPEVTFSLTLLMYLRMNYYDRGKEQLYILKEKPDSIKQRYRE